MSRSGVSSEKGTTQSTQDRAASTFMRLARVFTGRESPLSRFTEASSFTATTSRSPRRLGFFEIGDMTGVQDVEHAVGHDDAFALAAGMGDRVDHRRLVHHAATAAAVGREPEFRRR